MSDRPKDLHLNSAGDLELGRNGDLACSYDDDVTADGIIFRLKTYAGDYDLEPGCGASLEDFIGQPNTAAVGEQIRARAFRALTHDRFIDPQDLELDVAPLDASTVVLVMSVKGIRGTFSVISSLDLLTGKIKAMPA